MTNSYNNLAIPADVPSDVHQQFIDNYQAITRGFHRLFLFACDQKMEHIALNSALDVVGPDHFFTIAAGGSVGVMAAHLGLIARYGKRYPNLNYLIKINGKTDLMRTEQKDPFSSLLWSIENVIRFKEVSGLAIRAIGITVYIGSESESVMLAQAAQAIFQAHQHGLVTVVWLYPRGRALINDRSSVVVLGAVNVAACLGADFVKVNLPNDAHENLDSILQKLRQAAGETKIIIAGGPVQDDTLVLELVRKLIDKAGIAGVAFGRNLHQRPLDQAQLLAQKLAAILYS
jgi:DhnA family fructose-bisphosphate aldolase class Ia